MGDSAKLAFLVSKSAYRRAERAPCLQGRSSFNYEKPCGRVEGATNTWSWKSIPRPLRVVAPMLTDGPEPAICFASSLPTCQECANGESLCKRGSGKDARSAGCSRSWHVRGDFSQQTKGSRSERIGSLCDANDQGHYARHVVFYELPLGNEWRQ